ncbi:HAMP domain protein [Clostridium argentinense CDC 2741]|uniref:histidine kinase n=1 Tax=Clostridium argentinense CDC 2741 TaxID=1418104 RepID=A0A0C1U7A2_9CLOT|nr:HAMP domain-containing sensor histidine kinase [Clostridium argentinense]ARC84569.1 two-component sensor histidine kinase [Clostridium argentinense]KIE47698.1 HAMP domain protein [Clostridium argentinense CDC 2741]NFF38648.1 HAMP domain-containing histidine kinase [Clostridium argentinense]NFP48873.1 HAMP domain-containing histidine kinase [Clostridium argentinense]NFP72979.1 HAMP domain-containing histidine kinase [Clostridium argentinense]
MKLKYKFLIGFLAVFSIAFYILNFFISKNIEKNNKVILSKEMRILYQNSQSYITQYFVLNSIEISEKGFKDNTTDIIVELSDKNNCNVSLYDKDGNILNSSYGGEDVTVFPNFKEDVILGSNEDLNMAKQDKLSFLVNNIENKIIVNLSYPLYINKNFLGIVRFSKDYTYLYEGNNNLLNIVRIIVVITFIIIFIFSYLLSIKITNPIMKLSEASREVAKGNYDVEISIKSQDEIGKLSEDFINMKDKIKSQIETLKEIQAYRKKFFDNVTHELKTPLTTISGYAEILSEEEFSDDEFSKKAINHIKDESGRLEKMVIELLEISKLDSFDHKKIEVERFNFSNLLEDLCYHMSFKANKYNMDIEDHVQDNIYIYGDESKLKQVIINLLDNSIKYGKSNSTIEVKANIIDNYCEIDIKNKLTDNEEKEEGSRGLGIYICKNIIELHKGIFTIEDINNEFKLVKFKIPLN